MVSMKFFEDTIEDGGARLSQTKTIFLNLWGGKLENDWLVMHQCPRLPIWNFMERFWDDKRDNLEQHAQELSRKWHEKLNPRI